MCHNFYFQNVCRQKEYMKKRVVIKSYIIMNMTKTREQHNNNINARLMGFDSGQPG